MHFFIKIPFKYLPTNIFFKSNFQYFYVHDEGENESWTCCSSFYHSWNRINLFHLRDGFFRLINQKKSCLDLKLILGSNQLYVKKNPLFLAFTLKVYTMNNRYFYRVQLSENKKSCAKNWEYWLRIVWHLKIK